VTDNARRRAPRTAQWARLRDIRDHLLRLHKAIIVAERTRYEAAHGTIANEVALFHLVSGDPFFAWLRPMTVLIVGIDERLDGQEPVGDRDLAVMGAEVRSVLVSTELGNEFRRNYQRLLQAEPHIVVDHGRVMRLLPSGGAGDETPAAGPPG
jgi:hypothetical protein